MRTPELGRGRRTTAVQRLAPWICGCIALAGCGDASRVAPASGPGPAPDAVARAGGAEAAKPGAPKTVDVEVPAWARDDDGCEAQGLPSGGGTDDVAGVEIGMPATQIQALLKCYRVSIVYANGSFYFPEPASRPVGIDTWLISASREHAGYGELIEVLLAGPPNDQRAVRISYALKYPGPVERLPALDAAVKRAEAKYGPLQGAGGYRYSIAGLDGALLELNSPGALACASATSIVCGRRLVVNYSLGPNGTVTQQNIELTNGRIAAPILHASTRKPG